MNIRYITNDTKENDLYIGVMSHYFEVNEARKVFRNAREMGNKDDSILIEIAREGAKEVEAAITFGVKEGEKFALALLNLCQLIKD